MAWLTDFAQSLTDLLDITIFSFHGVSVTVASLLLFVFIVLLSLLLGRFANRGMVRVLQRSSPPHNPGTSYAIGRIVQYTVTSAGVFIALENIGFSLSALAALGAVFAVGLGFGLQNIAQNFVSGLILLLERPIKKGDVVVVNGTYGIVDEISIRATRIMTFDDVALIVPNGKLVSDIVENRSEPTPRFRMRIDVGVAYGSDTRRVEQTLLDVATATEQVLADPAPVVFFLNFGDSSLDFQLCVWLDDPLSGYSVGTAIRHSIIQAFRKADITIPFPQRDVHMHATKHSPRNADLPATGVG